MCPVSSTSATARPSHTKSDLPTSAPFALAYRLQETHVLRPLPLLRRVYRTLDLLLGGTDTGEFALESGDAVAGGAGLCADLLDGGSGADIGYRVGCQERAQVRVQTRW